MVKVYFFMLVGVGIINLLYSIRIVRELAEAGIKVSVYELRWQVHKHLKTYRDVTRSKGGRVGFPLYGYIVSLVLLVVLALLLILALTEPSSVGSL